MITKYKYITLSAPLAYGLFQQPRPTSHLPDDIYSQAIREALEQGYRWVRTDAGVAIFELEYQGNPPNYDTERDDPAMKQPETTSES